MATTATRRPTTAAFGIGDALVGADGIGTGGQLEAGNQTGKGIASAFVGIKHASGDFIEDTGLALSFEFFLVPFEDRLDDLDVPGFVGNGDGGGHAASLEVFVDPTMVAVVIIANDDDAVLDVFVVALLG